jgi:hypothetical protein
MASKGVGDYFNARRREEATTIAKVESIDDCQRGSSLFSVRFLIASSQRGRIGRSLWIDLLDRPNTNIKSKYGYHSTYHSTVLPLQSLGCITEGYANRESRLSSLRTSVNIAAYRTGQS